VSGLGLTNSGNTFSINLSNNSGLTLSNSGLSINAVGFGLTLSNNSLSNSLVSGNGITISSSGIVSTRVDNLTGLYNNNGLNYIGWEYFLGSGLTWSGTQLNTTTSAIRKFSNTYSFTASLPTTLTHNLATTDIIIQMYEISTGEEVLAQYTNRLPNSVNITTFSDVIARVVIIG